MAIIPIDAHIHHRTLTTPGNTFSLNPGTGSYPGWSASDLFTSEFGFNTPDQKIYANIGNNEIVQIYPANGSGGGGTGSTGPQGPTGTQGPQGNNGSNGATGSQGPQGNNGTQGSQGNTGTQGSQGNTGTQGSQGPQGSNGSNGATGSQGPQGSNGSNGATGSQGPQGNQGNQGPQGNQGNTGAGTQGPQGNTGSAGTQGNQGPQGNTGAGTQGPQGNTGSQGTQGNQGKTGPQGNTGSQGNQGFQGPTGPSSATASLTATYVGYGSSTNLLKGNNAFYYSEGSKVFVVGFTASSGPAVSALILNRSGQSYTMGNLDNSVGVSNKITVADSGGFSVNGDRGSTLNTSVLTANPQTSEVDLGDIGGAGTNTILTISDITQTLNFNTLYNITTGPWLTITGTATGTIQMGDISNGGFGTTLTLLDPAQVIKAQMQYNGMPGSTILSLNGANGQFAIGDITGSGFGTVYTANDITSNGQHQFTYPNNAITPFLMDGIPGRVPVIVASIDLSVSLGGLLTPVLDYTPIFELCTYQIGGYMNLISIPGAAFGANVTYLDENSNSITKVLQFNGSNGLDVVSTSATDNYNFTTFEFRALSGQDIQTNITGSPGVSSNTYDVGFTLEILRNF